MATMSTIVVLIFMTLIFAASVNSAALSNAVRRDTDESTNLRAKLHKLHALLSELYAEEKPDADPAESDPNSEAKAEEEKVTESEDSKELGELSQQDSPVSEEAQEQQEEEKRSSPDQYDESVQILARALSNLRKPAYENKDSTGAYLRSEYNEPIGQSERVRGLQSIVARALLKMKQDKRAGDKRVPQQSYDTFEEGSFGDFVDAPEDSVDRAPEYSRIGAYHNEAVKAIELRLMRDLQLATKLGVSVDELIQDLEGKAYREAQIREVERQLANLERRPYK